MGFLWHEWLIFTERTHNGQALTHRILSLQHFYSLYSYILVRTETPVNTKTEWHYLLAVLICCSFSSIPGFHSFDSTKHSSLHTKGHTHTNSVSFSTCPNVKLYQGCLPLPVWPYFFSPSVGRPSLFWQLCFWYLYFYRILITLCFIFHASPL